MNWKIYRTVVLEGTAQQELDRAIRAWPRANEAHDGLEWLLARDPHRGWVHTSGGKTYRLYVQDPDPIAATPRITALYSFDDRQVTIYSLKFS